MLANVVHPLHRRVIPARGRYERIAVRPERTPVEIPEADAGTYERIELPDYHPFGTRPLYVRDGAIWAPLLSRQGTVTPGDLLKFLEWGSRSIDGGGDGDDWFRGTPVMATTGGRGETKSPNGGELIAEYDDRTRQAVRDCMQEGHAIVGNRVMARLSGPLVSLEGYRIDRIFYRIHAIQPAHPIRWALSNPLHLTDFDRLNRARVDDPGPLRDVQGRMLASLGSGFPADLIGDEDLRLFANRACVAVLTDRMRTLEGTIGDAWEAAALREAMDKVCHWAALGLGGMVTLREAPEAIADLSEMLGRAFRSVPRLARDPNLAFMRDYADTFALPRLAAPAPIDDADMEALAGIMP